MWKLLVVALLAIVGFAAYRYYVPEDTREKGAELVDAVVDGDKGRIGDLVSDLVLPKDPKERREVLISELKDRVNAFGETVTMGIASTSVRETANALIAQSWELLQQLEQANEDRSIKDRVIDAILPNTCEMNKEELTE